MKFRLLALAPASVLILSLVSAPAQTSSRVVGSITAISGQTLTVQPDKGPPANITVSDDARVLRAEPGAKKLSAATPIALTDLSVGDRVLVLVKDGSARTVVAMKQADIAQRQAAETAAWQSGANGLVKTVDAATGTVTIRSGGHTITIQTTPKTIIRRYSLDSALFSNAKPSDLNEIHPGDQLRARGQRNADGSEIAADAIVSGNFRNVAGTVVSVDLATNSVTVANRLTKKQILIHIDAASQLHKLPPQMAKELTAQLQERREQARRRRKEKAAAATQHAPATYPNGGQHSSGQRGGSLSRMLQSTPAVTLTDLHKGDAVIIVATQGTPQSATAITLLAGVESILRAFPSGSSQVFSASWNLSGGAPGAAGGGGGGGGGGGAP